MGISKKPWPMRFARGWRISGHGESRRPYPLTVALRKTRMQTYRRRNMRVVCSLVIGLLALTSSKAQAAPFQIVSNGEAAGIIVGIVAVGVGVGVGITYLIVHERNVAEGCIAEAAGKKT